MCVFVFAQAQQNVKTSGGKRGRKNKKIKMAVLLRRAAAAAAVAAVLVVAAVCADGASTFYSSDPNLGSARVVFQVTRHLLYSPCYSNCDW